VTPRAARAVGGGRRRPVVVVAALALAGLGTVSCGIPTDHSPRLLDRRDMPGALTGATTTTLIHPGGSVALKIYLVHNTASRTVLQPVSVEVAEKSTIVSQAEAALQALIAAQPATRPATATLTNVIPSATRILHASLDGDVLDLDLSRFDLQIVATQQKLAFAEMVFTLTELNGIDAVKFSLAGQPAQAPVDSGASTAGAAIRRRDYRQLYPSH
jgi:Sporulation and spore germination